MTDPVADAARDDPGSHERRLVVGMVRGLHGLRGGLRVEILSDDPSRFQIGSVLHPEGSDEPLTIEWSQEDGPGVLVRFEEMPTREVAAGLRDRYLEADVMPDALDEGAFYWHELMDVPVSTSDGELLGTVADVFRAGGGEVLVVRGGERGEVLVPAVSAVVSELAPREGRIIVERDALDIAAEPARKRPRGRRTTRALRSGSAE
ncbi:MAG: 16S rRNA processing protein RimM [Chloroflexi bacterium]|nr:16S rRNA processing protein RimM [Chloroflexota bacterium]